MEAGKSYCIVWDIRAAMIASTADKAAMYPGRSVKETNRAIMLAHNAGMSAVPSCENHGPDGHCTGHDANEKG